MILSFAVICGIVIGLARAAYYRQVPLIPDIHYSWLVLIGFLPQYFVFFSPRFNHRIPPATASFVLVASLFVMLIFAWFNRKEAGFRLLMAGVTLNLLVIVANGGWMPISPETIERLSLPASFAEREVSVGERFGGSKDIVLPREETRFWWLSDIFVLPRDWVRWLPVGSAFSIGDVLLAAGVIRFFWYSSRGASEEQPVDQSFNTAHN